MIGKILKFFVGDKSKKDLKLINPIIDKIHSFHTEISNFSNDELRAETIHFKNKILNATSSLHNEIDKIKSEIEKETDINQKESLFSKIDKINQEIYQISESCLEEILPKAFAVVKETASRFVNNKNISVTATDFDLKIAQTKDYVEIKKDLAVWKNNWDAAGKNIVWDMVHYDVQLIGGVAMHQGKIAEMQTGEGKTLVATLPVFLNALT